MCVRNKEPNLLEDDLCSVQCIVRFRGGNFFNRLGRIQRRYVKCVLFCACLDEVQLRSVWITVPTSGCGSNEDRAGEVVAEDGSTKCLVHFCHIVQEPCAELDLRPNVEIVAVTPFACRGRTVEGVLLIGEFLTSCKVEIWDAAHVF